MKVRIIKSLLSVYGAMVPGKEIAVPDHIARSWIRNGIAVGLDAPNVIPAGRFWCAEHRVLHKLNSALGRKCLRRVKAENEKAKEATKAEAARVAEEAKLPEKPEAAGQLEEAGVAGGGTGEALSEVGPGPGTADEAE